MQIKTDYKLVIPKIFHDADYEKDVKDDIKQTFEKQVRSGKGLYIWGTTGVGKTHLACAMVKKMLEIPIASLFYNTGDFLDEIKREFEKGVDYEERDESIYDEAKKLRGVLFLDDIGAEKATEWSTQRLSQLVNYRYEEMLPTVFTSNCDLEVLSARMGDRISSRIFGMSEIVHIVGQDKRITL